MPKAMIVICTGNHDRHLAGALPAAGPSFHHHAHSIPLGWVEAAVAVGFFGLLAAAVTEIFPTISRIAAGQEGGNGG
jgi:TRAP-type C4-dicarboxylate transport system permease small subunit